jgi:cysteine synthase A
MALAMIEGAERSGRLRPGQPVVEYTGGSTGSSLALVCSIKGYPLYIVSSDAFAPEKTRTMRAFGANVELLPSPEGITPTLIPRMRARAAEIAAETGAYQTDQFNNTDMTEGYRAIGRELFEQLDGRIDAIAIYPGAARASAGPAPDRGRAGRVCGAVRACAGHPPDRGRRRRVRSAAAQSR